MLCTYGCGNEAKFKFLNGKYCCKESRNQCPVLKSKNKNSNTGRKHSRETIEKMSSNMKGIKKTKPILLEDNNDIFCSNGCKQLAKYKFKNSYWCSDHINKCPINKEKNRIRKIEEFKKPDIKEKHRNNIIESWKEESRIEKHNKSLETNRKKEINNLEKFIRNILPDRFEFTGDYTFWIGSKNPDFIDKNRKQIVEVFGQYWHSKEITGKEEYIHEYERKDYFNKHGYECLVIWDYEIKNIEILKNKIFEFIKEN